MSTIKANNVQHVDATSANIALDSSGNVTLANNLTVDTNTLFVNATNNRVGLGTSSPSTNIEINAALDTGVSLGLNEGQLSVGREANSGGAVRIGYDTTNNFGFISSGRVGTSWDKLILNAGGGNVGIGTTSPSSLLAVHQASASTANYINITNDATGTSSLSNGMLVGVSTSGAALCWQNENLDLLFGTNNTERARIDSSGRVGIGTQTPGELLTVNGNIRIGSDGIISGGSSSNGTRIQGGATFPGGHIILNGGNSSDNIIFNRSGASTSSIETARIDSSGRLLVGTSSARSNFFNSSFATSIQLETSSTTGRGLSVANTVNSDASSIFILAKSRGSSVGSTGIVSSGDHLSTISFQGDDGTEFVDAARIECYVDGTPGSNDMPGRLVFSTTADGASSPTERMRIGADGYNRMFAANNVSVVMSAQGAGTSFPLIEGNHSATSIGSNNGTVAFRVWTNGNVVNTNNSYGSISDIKLKENIVDANSQWKDLKALQVRNYNFKEGQTHTQIGLVAQEVELVSPGLVTESPDRDEEGNDLGTVTKSVNYSVLYMKAVKALQEAMERIEQLETEMAVVKAQLS